MLGQPVLTAVLAGPLLHEYLSGMQVVGGIAVLLGVYIVHRSRTKAAPIEYQVASLESGS
jgi:drug/metabolite transporter (DMT)-like permease